jgi:hypothetical protein
MEMIVIETSEFWTNHKEITRQIVKEVIKEEIRKISINQQKENIIQLEIACSILGKSKQSIYNYMKKGRIQGYNFRKGIYEKADPNKKQKEREPLYFKRDEIEASFVKREK